MCRIATSRVAPIPSITISGRQKVIIRFIDIVVALTGILVGLPIMLAIYLLGLLESSSPLFFQQRVGKNQQLFTLVKFRSMAPGTKSVGTHQVDAASVTRMGNFLRKFKLDELPQLFNVLLGQMSLVGPRPCLPNQTELIIERSKRGVFAVPPGITGLAQVNHVDMSTPRKLARYDQLMIKHMCLRLYIKLIIITASGQGRGDRVRASIV